MSDPVQARIDELVKQNRIMLFMKGTKFFPQCGFSARAVGVLRHLDASFETFDVLSDMSVREGIKAYSSWPTIPQLYIGGEFVGGSDIMMELFENGELAKMVATEG